MLSRKSKMEQIVIELAERYDERGRQIDQARCGELLVEKSRGSVIGALCRKLIDDGADPATRLEVVRDAVTVFKPATLGRFAGLRVVENDRTGPVFKPWRAFPADGSDAVKTNAGADGGRVPGGAASNGARDGTTANGNRPPRSERVTEAARGMV